MQIKDLIPLLVIPAVVLSVSVPQDHANIPNSDTVIEKRIVGGQEAGDGEFTYATSIFQDNLFTCGGSYLDEYTVVTSATCVDKNVSRLLVHVGSNNLIEGGGFADVASVIFHPNYKEESIEYNVAILKLPYPVPKEYNLTYPRLPHKKSDPSPGTLLTVAGWGSSSPEGEVSQKLMKIDVSVVSRESCQDSYPKANVSNQMFCAGSEKHKKDTCPGDGGIPIVNENKTVIMGQASWAIDCAKSKRPTVFTNYGDESIHNFLTENLK